MKISQKCSYALRAVLELAQQPGDDPLSIAAIGQAQGIPAPFLQIILRELRQGGFVESRRGKAGGYVLAKPAGQITMGDIIRFVDGEISPINCLAQEKPAGCPHNRDCPFLGVWHHAARSLNSIYDGVTFADLADKARSPSAAGLPEFVI